VVDALDNLEAVTRQPDLHQNVDRINAALGRIVGGAKVGDRVTVDANLKKVNDLGNKMKHQGDFLASQNTNPQERQRIAAAAIGLKQAIGALDQAAKSGKRDVQPEATAVTKAANELAAATNADPLSALQRVLDKTNELERAGTTGDVDSIVDTSPKFNNATDALIAQVTGAIAASRDPVQKKRLQDANAELPHAAKALLVAAKGSTDAPHDHGAKARMHQAADDMRDVLRALESALQNKVPAPVEKQSLDKKIAALESVVPKLRADNNKLVADPRNPRNKQQVIASDNKVKAKLHDVAGSVARDPEEEADLSNRSARQRVRDMVKAVNESNHPSCKRSYGMLEKELPDHKVALRKAAGARGPDRVREVEEALLDIDALMPKVAHAAREVEANPTDLAKKNNFHSAAQRLDRAFARAADKAAPPKDERQVRDAAAELRERLARIRAARKTSPQQVEPEIEDWRKVRLGLRRVGDKKWDPEGAIHSKELEDIWNKFGLRNKQAAASPKSNDDAELNALEKQVEEKLNNMERAINANKVATVLDAKAKLDDVLGAVEAKQPERARERLQELAAIVQNVQRDLGDSPANAQAQAFMEPVKEVIRRANAAVHTQDDALDKEVAEAIKS